MHNSVNHDVRERSDLPNLKRLLMTQCDDVMSATLPEIRSGLGADASRMNEEMLGALDLGRIYAMGQETKHHALASHQLLPVEVDPQPSAALQSPLVIYDHSVPHILRDRSLLRGIKEVEEACTVDETTLYYEQPAKGIYFAHTLAELRKVLEVKDAQILTIQDRQGRIWGTAIYHTDGREFADEDHELVDAARKLRGPDGVKLIGKHEKLAVGHLVCIDEGVNDVFAGAGLSLQRGEAYLEMHAHFIAELRQKGITKVIAMVRPDNPAMQHAHAVLGWRSLTGDFAPHVTKSVYLPTFGREGEVNFTILVLDPNDARQDRLLARAGRIPFVDLDIHSRPELRNMRLPERP